MRLLGAGIVLIWIGMHFAVQAAAEVADPDLGPPFAATSAYDSRQIEGWRVMVIRGFSEANLCDDTLALLRCQLYQITRAVPARAAARLREVTIWVEETEPHHPCMAYHPSADWLRNHGMNPDKARCVEIANARNFLAWTRQQPWMVLHELAHAYHDQCLGGYESPELIAEFERATREKKYEAVLRINGSTGRAYAATNPMEYFAETTEALFGTNDFYPFVCAELKQHDPRMYDLLERLWEVRPRIAGED